MEEGFCEIIAIQPEGEEYTTFADYLADTLPKFSLPLQIWPPQSAHWLRTTNACESCTKNYPAPNPKYTCLNFKLCPSLRKTHNHLRKISSKNP